MSIFQMDHDNSIGQVQSVDTASVVVHVTKADQLSKLQVNHLVVIRSSKRGQCLIGMVNKIVRQFDELSQEDDAEVSSRDIVRINLIGTLFDRVGRYENVFKRTLESVPEIDADCFVMADEELTAFMSVISRIDEHAKNPLLLGTYTLNEKAKAYIDGDKFFQRHAVITGSTGSGKSFTVAKIVEQIAKLPACNALLFDIHGEYKPLSRTNIKHYKIAGPSDTAAEGILFLPYWLLTYEEMLSLLLDRSDMNAPNQAMLFRQYVIEYKQASLAAAGRDISFTIDSPISYAIQGVLTKLSERNEERVEGARGDKAGDYNGKLSRFISRLQSKLEDRRLNFMFSNDEHLLNYEYMPTLCSQIMAPGCSAGGVKIIDFSEVPSDVLPLIVSLVARLVFSVQQWARKQDRHPIALLCDEAHLYIPEHTADASETSSLASFERIAKEGRKYGVGLVVITQRPSEVSRTVLSQSSNFVAMRLTNYDDQNVIKRLLPDSIGNYADLLPILDIGEALVVGDASLLPSRIHIDEPEQKPDSATVKFWTEWSKDTSPDYIADAVEAMRKQSRT